MPGADMTFSWATPSRPLHEMLLIGGRFLALVAGPFLFEFSGRHVSLGSCVRPPHCLAAWPLPPAYALGFGAKPPEYQQDLPLDALRQTWQNGVPTNESQKQFSFTRVALRTSGCARKQVPAISSTRRGATAGDRLCDAASFNRETATNVMKTRQNSIYSVATKWLAPLAWRWRSGPPPSAPA